jgi:hypothetical protein
MQTAETSTEKPEIGAFWREAMLAGDFEAAWRQTDRIELPRRLAERSGHFDRQPHHLLWNGEPFTNRRVLVRCEHGLGDTIMFARYFPLLRRQARQVIVKAQPMLLPLLEGMNGVDLLLNAWTTDSDPPHDVAIECMELAYAFRSKAETLPVKVPYLPASRLRQRASFEWPNEHRCNVGLVWAASDWDTSRSLAIENLAPLARVEEVTFHSLQQGGRAAEISSAPIRIEPLSEKTREVADAAAAVLAVDLVIAVDTMVAHLAGALARPVWLLLQAKADWRWIRGCDRSPWYPTMRIFRQPQSGDWHSVMEAVSLALRGRVDLSIERS